jgi:hypothetical protein
MRNSVGQRLGNQLVHTKADALEANTCLRLQTRAWRVCALIALVDKERGAATAKWLFFVSVPFVDGRAVQQFLDREEKNAEQYGKQSGVFG